MVDLPKKGLASLETSKFLFVFFSLTSFDEGSLVLFVFLWSVTCIPLNPKLCLIEVHLSHYNIFYLFSSKLSSYFIEVQINGKS
jgi:hypothetical protein